MQIDLWTLAIQAVNFLVLVWLLSRLLFRPVRRIIERRRTLYREHMEEATKKAEQADAAKADFQAKAERLEAERTEKAAQAHKALQAEREEILQKARDEANEMRANARKQIAADRDRALAAAKDQIIELAADLARKVLTETAADSTGPATLQHLLDALPEDRAAALREDLAPANARLRVVTAAPMSADRQKSWTKALQRSLGTDTDPQFEVEPDLLGGVELRLPHEVLDLSWAGKLDAAAKRIREDDDES